MVMVRIRSLPLVPGMEGVVLGKFNGWLNRWLIFAVCSAPQFLAAGDGHAVATCVRDL